jgi:hypothetical protein
MANRFEQCDEPVDDAISVILQQRADGQWAKVYCPMRLRPEPSAHEMSESLPPRDALSSAVKLANELKLAIVVVDPDGVWKKEWGELYRDEEASDPV